MNRRKSGGGGKKPLWTLIVVAALIALSVFLLEQARKKIPPQPKQGRSIPVEHRKLPPRTPPAQDRVTSAQPQPEKQVALPPRPKGPGNVAIIVDDMGASLKEANALIAIRLPLTFSVIPSLAKARSVAELAHRAGVEVMVHMPMQPQGYPKQPMEKVGLLVAMDDAEVERRVNGFCEAVPFAVGANNHMGSRFTEDETKMEAVLKVLKQRGMFFVDSRTSPASVGYRVAHSLGLKAGTRQVFLDNVQDEGAIKAQLAQVAGIARRAGGAIAICHPHPATIRALKTALPALARDGITFVHASDLVS